jgi:hypothetical protein
VGGATLGLALAQRGLAGGGDRRRGTLCAVIGLLCVGLSFPIGAWAASGMETGVATTLATIAAASFARPRRAALFAGLAASLRPELVVWSAVITGGSALARESAWDATKAARRVALSLAMSCVPFSICALVRLVAFGRAAPLAILAKPSDVAHGLVYAGAASLVTLTPVLAFAPLALRRASMMEKTIAAAAAAHVLVVIAVGGDWMPYARLMVPIAPSLALVFVGTARTSHPVSITTRTLAVVALGVWLAMTAAPAGRHVHGDRKDLIARARPLLSGARIVAALDVGWVGAATNAEIVDLAGLTDPSFATLSGGHTSKAVDVSMLLDRDIDAIVVFTPPRIVETRITRAALFARHFERAADVALGDKGAFYTIYRRRSASPVDDASP